MKYFIWSLLALCLLLMGFTYMLPPETTAERVTRQVDHECAIAMEDAALGDDRRNVRAFCKLARERAARLQ